MIKAVIYTILQVMDMVATKYCLSRHMCYEANPLMALFMYDNLPAAILLKAIATIGVLILYFIIKKRSEKTANIMMISLIIFYILVILNSFLGVV